jgi:hypothetical protein
VAERTDCFFTAATGWVSDVDLHPSAQMPREELSAMQTVKFVYWEEDGARIGYLQDYPDYWIQGEMLDDLREHLRDIYNDVTNGELTGIRKFDELVVP